MPSYFLFDGTAAAAGSRRPGGREPRRSRYRRQLAWRLVSRLIGSVAQQVTGLAPQCLAEPGERAEADGPRAAVLEYGQVDDGDADAFRQLGEGHAALFEQGVQADLDGRRLVADAGLGAVSGAGNHTVPLISSSIAPPSLIMRAKVSSAAPARTATGNRPRTASKITAGKDGGPTSMLPSSWFSATARTRVAAVALNQLLGSMLVGPPSFPAVILEAVRGLFPVAVLAGAALLTFARIIRLGGAMDDEIKGTV